MTLRKPMVKARNQEDVSLNLTLDMKAWSTKPGSSQSVPVTSMKQCLVDLEIKVDAALAGNFRKKKREGEGKGKRRGVSLKD